MRPSSLLLNQMTKWTGIDAAAFSDSSSPRRVAKSSLHAAAKMPRRRMFLLLRPATRSGFAVQNLRPWALHAAVGAKYAAAVRLGAQHLVATLALISQECRHGGHHLFPLGSAYRAGQDRNLDCSASHRAVNSRLEKCFRGGIKSCIAARSQSCTASRGILPPPAACLRRFSGGRGCSPALQPHSWNVALPSRIILRRRLAPRKCSASWNALPAKADRWPHVASEDRAPRIFRRVWQFGTFCPVTPTSPTRMPSTSLRRDAPASSPAPAPFCWFFFQCHCLGPPIGQHLSQ